MDKDRPPPAMGGGGVANRQLPPNRKPNDAKNPKQRRVSQKNSPCYIFRRYGGVTLFTNRLVAVGYALSSSEWDFIRWVASAQGGWL
jgi:hypothetical protein